MKWGRIAVIGVVAVAAVAGIWWAFTPKPLVVETAAVTTGDLVISVDDEGIAKMRNVVEVSMPVGGELLRLPVRVGDKVVAGEVVATIEPMESALLDSVSRAEAEAAVRAAEDAVLAAQSEFDMAKSEQAYWQAEAARKESLLEKGVTTAQALQQVQLELTRRLALVTSSEAALDMRKHQLEQAEARLVSNGRPEAIPRRRDVKAAMAGEILTIANESGRSLPAGTPLMEIGEPGALEVVVDLLSADAVRIKVGAAASISGWGGAEVLKARVERIEPTGFTKVSALGVEEQRVPVHLELLDPPSSRPGLGHRYRVFAEIEAQHLSGVTLVPAAALFRVDNAWSVFVIDGDKAAQRAVTIGGRTAEWAEVTEGLAAGDTVIVHPNDQIADGTLVQAR